MTVLNDKVALVTGGRRGIGFAIVQALQAAGAAVAVVGRELSGPGNMYIPCELSDRSARAGLVEKVVQRFGRLDILVNNAGGQYHEPVARYAIDRWDYDLELMLTAPLDLCQQAIPYLPDGGHIVNILSTSAYQGARTVAGYVSAKHGLLGLTRCMAIELAPAIHVNAVAPGLIETDMTSHVGGERKALLNLITPAHRFGLPWEAAQAVMYLLSSTFVYGQTVFVDGGWMAKNG